MRANRRRQDGGGGKRGRAGRGAGGVGPGRAGGRRVPHGARREPPAGPRLLAAGHAPAHRGGLAAPGRGGGRGAGLARRAGPPAASPAEPEPRAGERSAWRRHRPAFPSPARPGPDAAPASVLQDIVCGPADSRAPRERLAGEGGARGHGGPGGRGRANGALPAGPMESPARPSAAGPRGRLAEEPPPPEGENRYVHWAGPREPPSRGSRPPPFRPAGTPVVLRTGRKGGSGLHPGQAAPCGGLGAWSVPGDPSEHGPREGGLAGAPRDGSPSLCCSALGKAGERSEGDVEDCASPPCVEGNFPISGRFFGF